MTRSNYQTVLAALDNCRDESTHLLAKIEHLRTQVEALRRENAALRRKVRESSREARQIRTAVDAAQYLTLMHIMMLPTSRDECMADGMPRSHWYWARALLIDSRVHDGRRFTTSDADEIDRAISRTLNRYNVQGGIWSLRLRNAQLSWN